MFLVILLITIEHNGKKKTSAIAYKPLVDTSNIPAVVETQKINEIPPYEDKGVRYQGKYKAGESSKFPQPYWWHINHSSNGKDQRN